ncbi:hypothetical protein [Rufibacter latericius]|uniref:STAS/SEC14 domain-containing protein n=1 Tax=Rufibacter latericius TaxID=2487040 RepID=A0A3M9MBR9_9BACT|nr:hypothetical protein [Rufibacter latericius]RNI23011.1 hypothetical protein EFB08_19645 [Rufibacter latericius]
MIQIAYTPFYQMKVDRKRNRIFIKVEGCWNTPEEVPFYFLHLEEALACLTPGFSILTDIRGLEEYSPAVRRMHIEAQKLTVAAGISQLAEVHHSNTPVNQLSMFIAEESKIPLNIFDSLEDAEDWLEGLL